MGGWVTVSTKVRRELVERAKRHGVNISEVLRRALEEEVARREEEEARRSARRIAGELRMPEEEVARLIREDRSR
ncbi:MAG: type II toxin-antitoxin system CcdA family antitoxin [Thermoproteus sp.]|nr:type II toxin-antitoxin system CcdA family antitoxin [Thermoproteus sp.]MDT7882561.1 type II toxin-antitoxin system CcdA family antitoxin [Thermoproteus sp.]